MTFFDYIEQFKDIINKPLKDFQIDYLNLKWNDPDEFAYSKLLKIILICLNKLPLYIRIFNNKDDKAIIAIGANDYFLHTNTEYNYYNDFDFKRLENNSIYAARLIIDCLLTELNGRNFLKGFSEEQLAKFLDMTKIVVK